MSCFVYRTHYEGPLSKRVRHLPDATVLDWFRRGWAAVVDDGRWDATAWIQTELGGDVYGLHTLFERAREHDLPAPNSWRELRDLLREHLYFEGDLRVDEHSVRVHTDDDEVELPYFFFDDTLVAARPDAVAYLLHDGWPLPDAPEAPPRDGEGMTHAVLLTFYDSDSICWQPPFVFPGVRLPDLAAHLRATTPGPKEWPGELLVLRALVAPEDDDLGPALGRCNHWPSYEAPMPEIAGGHHAAHEFAMRVLRNGEPDNGRDPSRTLLRSGAHLAQMSIHMHGFFGHQQWFLFDDVWAGQNEDLAGSLLRYATDWDPFGLGPR
jgi:hypothetical protein